MDIIRKSKSLVWTTSYQQRLPIEVSKLTRRNFSVAGTHGMLATILATLGLPTAAYLLVPSRIRPKDDFID